MLTTASSNPVHSQRLIFMRLLPNTMHTHRLYVETLLSSRFCCFIERLSPVWRSLPFPFQHRFGNKMNESIYNLVPQERYEAEKKPMYRSSNDMKASVPGSTFGCFGTTRLYGAGQIVKKDGALFGPPKTEYNLPKTTALTKKGSLSNSAEFKYTEGRKEAIPSKDDRPIMGITTTKNFVTANAVEAILQAPKQTGNMELNYMKKEDFGKVPAYLSQVKEEILRENQMIDRYVKEQMGEVEAAPEVYEEFSEYERIELVNALKAKWDSVNAQYQKITHLVKLDTTGQLRRKEQLEAALAKLEADIQRLDRSGPVLIKS